MTLAYVKCRLIFTCPPSKVNSVSLDDKLSDLRAYRRFVGPVPLTDNSDAEPVVNVRYVEASEAVPESILPFALV